MIHIDVTELPDELTATATIAVCEQFDLIARTAEALMDYVVETDPNGSIAEELMSTIEQMKENSPPTDAQPERVAKWVVGMPGLVQLVEEYSTMLTTTICAISESHKGMILFQDKNN